MSSLAIIVPARLESTRFPRKLLHPIQGKALLLRVAERLASEAPPGWSLHFAVDDPLLAEVLEPHGFATVMTSRSHASGTDRIAEANRAIRASRIINVQADEPLVTRRQLSLLADLLAGGDPMATLASPFARPADFFNPNQVKVVTNLRGQALYFSRSPIPYARDEGGAIDADWLRRHRCYRHLGLYAYSADFLETYCRLPPGRLEQLEKLEQLRALENGFSITIGETQDASIGVDTPDDADKYEQLLQEEIA